MGDLLSRTIYTSWSVPFLLRIRSLSPFFNAANCAHINSHSVGYHLPEPCSLVWGFRCQAQNCSFIARPTFHVMTVTVSKLRAAPVERGTGRAISWHPCKALCRARRGQPPEPAGCAEGAGLDGVVPGTKQSFMPSIAGDAFFEARPNVSRFRSRMTTVLASGGWALLCHGSVPLWLRRPRGAPRGGTIQRQQPCIRWSIRTETTMQPCASAARAPGWRVHSHSRHRSHGRQADHHHLGSLSASRQEAERRQNCCFFDSFTHGAG